jgi:ferritin-like metal-binding protein YciE
MAKGASSEQLPKGFEEHPEQPKGQVQCLERSLKA